MALQVYDTLRRGKVPFEPVNPGKVGMYICGMTVQGTPHVGHMRAFMTGDLIRRVFRARGYDVTLVQNFTDIDDKIIRKAAEAGMDTKDFAEKNIQAFFEAADWMGIERADHYPRATEHIPEIIALIEKLIEKGHAYASGGDVFFAVTSKDDYGKLSGKRVDELRTGVRIEVDEDKRHPVDFTLWKAAKEGEPAWDSPWGPGRPGWHIECSAMAMKYLGETIDLHGGSRDLVFPHHENELAQSEAATGCPFCMHWAEGGLVNLGGQKMSKSTGIAFNVADVRNEVESATLRLYLLSTHYRTPDRVREGAPGGGRRRARADPEPAEDGVSCRGRQPGRSAGSRGPGRAGRRSPHGRRPGGKRLSRGPGRRFQRGGRAGQALRAGPGGQLLRDRGPGIAALRRPAGGGPGPDPGDDRPPGPGSRRGACG